MIGFRLIPFTRSYSLQGYQESLRILLKDTAEKRIFDLVKPSRDSKATIVAEQIRKFVGIPIESHLGFRSAETAFKGWRHAIENCGVYTFKDSFKDHFVSGLCLIDTDFPVILVNNSASFTRQLFTIVHELGHILLQVDGLTDVSDEYLDHMEPAEREVEVACNEIAAKVLFPSNSFAPDIQLFRDKGMESVASIAQKYSVSREVILRRFLGLHLVSLDAYQEKASEWNADFLRSKKKKGGRGNYYLTKLAYLGEGYAKLAIGAYRQGAIPSTEAR